MSKYTFVNISISILLTYLYVCFINATFGNFWFIAICMGLMVLVTFAMLMMRQRNKNLRNFYRKNSTLIYYNRMQLMVSISLYANVWLFFVKYINNDGLPNFWLPLLIIFGTTALVLLLSVIWNVYAKRAWVKTSLFVVGSLLCATAFWFSEIEFFGISILYYILYSSGISMLLSAISLFSDDVEQAVTLFDENKFAIRWGYSVVNLKAQILTNLIFFALYIVFVLWLKLPLGLNIGLSLLSLICVSLSLIFVLAFPLDKIYANKLYQYYNNDSTVNKELLGKQLKNKLSKGNNSVYLAILRFLVKPFFKAKVTGKSNVDTSKGAVVFIANHYEIYGPIVTILRLPYNVRPWIISSMLDENSVEKQLKDGVDNVCHILPQKARNKVPSIIKPLLLKILNGLDPIPVYRGSTREVLTTLKLTVEAMQQGDNILLFPENPQEKYAQQGVDNFYTGFAEIGVRYYRATGKCTTFYPVYVDKYNKEICIGKGISFNADAESKEQKRFIAEYLNKSMQEMSQIQAEKFKLKKQKKNKKRNKNSDDNNEKYDKDVDNLNEQK